MSFPEINSEDFLERFEAEEIPTERDPFCNQTENSDYSESYSHVIPSFFFRNEKCRKRPSRYERKKLRYFYNTTGIILLTKLFIETAACLAFYILMFIIAFSFSPSVNLYYSALSDDTVKYAFRIIAVIASTASVFLAGCRFSELKPGHLFRSCRPAGTGEIVTGFMSGIFVAALANLISFSVPVSCSAYMPTAMYLERDWRLAAVTTLCNCIVIPVTDGLIFRGLVLKNLSRASQRTGILTAALLCALSTCSFPSMLPAFFMSLLLGSITVKYSSVLPSVFIHIAVNISSMAISAYSTFAWEDGAMLIKVWTIITLVIGGVFTFIRLVKEPLPKNKPEQRRRTFPVLITSVFLMLLFPLYIITSLAKLLYFMYM